LLRKPKVYTIHDYIPHSGEEKCRTIFLNKIFSRLHYQYILHSKLLKERFTQYYKVPSERVHSIYNGPLDIYKVFIASRENEDNNTVLFWGRIAKYKGLRCLLEAANIIKQEVPEIKIVICGKGTLDFKISDLDRGIFEINNAYLPNDTLVDYIKRSAIIVLPYTDATQSAVLMTAYAFNKPVVASRVGGIPEVIEDGITGILVPPGDAQELARAVVYLLNNPIRRRQMSENIRNKMVGGEFDWDFIVERITEVYKKAIREN
jgi:glycosyltransferase involved in cell wall biosynthesis